MKVSTLRCEWGEDGCHLTGAETRYFRSQVQSSVSSYDQVVFIKEGEPGGGGRAGEVGGSQGLAMKKSGFSVENEQAVFYI